MANIILLNYHFSAHLLYYSISQHFIRKISQTEEIYFTKQGAQRQDEEADAEARVGWGGGEEEVWGEGGETEEGEEQSEWWGENRA